MMWLYNVLWLLALPAVCCLLGVRRLTLGKYRRNLGPRFGLGLKNRSLSKGRRVIWLHALSVGEVLSALPLVHCLQQEFPSYQLVFSTTSEAGHRLARRRLASSNCSFFYLPLDLWWMMRRAVKAVGAELFLLVETDLWPNLLYYLDREGTPIVLVNGRLSDRSFSRYLRVRKLYTSFFQRITMLCLQSQEDSRRMQVLGIEPARIRVTGNLKFDQPLSRSPAQERIDLLVTLGLKPRPFTWVAGSTHAGEEEIILRIYSCLRQRFADFFLIMAPRNPERFGLVARLAEQKGWQTVRRSQLPRGAGLEEPDILVVDTIGELVQFYALGTFAFIGGSMVRSGGHNPLEAAQRGLPVVFGPHMENFKEIAAILVESGGGFQVHGEAGLRDRVADWLSAPHACQEQGKRAREAVVLHQGAVGRTMEVIRELLAARHYERLRGFPRPAGLGSGDSA
ncbi:MAG: 3-deoxy-D-manno-octulosonic acid transferase [Syntrophobacteria bacterium]